MIRESKGFTLIELLVVIVIIGILAAVVLVAMGAARAKARDVRRLADFHQIQLALSLYWDANGNKYPDYTAGSPTCASGWATYVVAAYQSCWNDLQSKLAPYMARLPIDPSGNLTDGNSFSYYYQSRNSGAGYMMVMLPELTSTGLGQGCYPGWYCAGVNW